MKNSLLFGILYGIVALLIVVSGVALWQKERTVPQVQPLLPSLPQTHPESAPGPTPSTKTVPDPTATWKTYRSKQYGFEFRYPDSWIDKKDICPVFSVGFDREFCLALLEYSTLPPEKEVDFSQGMVAEISTRERFMTYKRNIDQGILPPGYVSGPTGWKFVRIAGQNAIQILSYDLFTGFYVIETKLFTNDVGIFIQIFLPMGPYRYDSETMEAESEKKVQEIEKGRVTDKVKEALTKYQTLLSTFKFTE